MSWRRPRRADRSGSLYVVRCGTGLFFFRGEEGRIGLGIGRGPCTHKPLIIPSMFGATGHEMYPKCFNGQRRHFKFQSSYEHWILLGRGL